LEKRADSTQTKWSYVFCANPLLPAPTGAVTADCARAPASFKGSGGTVVGPSEITPVYYVQATPVKADGTVNGPYTRVYYDSLGREVLSETQGFDGGGTSQIVRQESRYNLDGTLGAKSAPYIPGVSPSSTVGYLYDTLGRVVQVAEMDAAGGPARTTMTYSGLTSTVEDPKKNKTTQVKNVAGQVVSITDAKAGVLTNAYDPMGNLVRTTDAKGNVVSMVYDKLGRRTALYDPDLGVWGYCHDALGQLKAQQDQKARGSSALAACPAVGDVGTTATAVAGWTTYAYDLLGRPTARVEPDLKTRWYHDSKYADGSACTTGIGQLCETTTDNGYARRHGYDGVGRPSSVRFTLNNKTYTEGIAYDPGSGRVSARTFPTGLQINNVYTPLGFDWKVVDARNNRALWTAQSQDPRGHYLKIAHGNGLTTTNSYYKDGRIMAIQSGAGNAVQNLVYSYDLNRNVSSRVELGANISTTYLYDELNRIGSETRTGGALGGKSQAIAWTYDAIGNMATRTEDGLTHTYNYNTSGLGSSRPHAVANVGGAVNGRMLPVYQYDSNGNLTSGAGRNVTWTSANMAQEITSGSTQLLLLYGPERDRVVENYFLNGARQRTTVYLDAGVGMGLRYEEETGTAGTKMKHFVEAGGSTVAMIVCTVAPCTNTDNSNTQYWHEDHLGSVSAITDASGAVIERLAYEPFGKRRDSNGSTDANGTLKGAYTDRGYTEQEHMDEVGLVNMNGRIYDPALGRFMSADPSIPYPSIGQSYNRYSYTRNNPVNAIDPSGFSDIGIGNCSTCYLLPSFNYQPTFSWTGSSLTLGLGSVGSLGGIGGSYLGFSTLSGSLDSFSAGTYGDALSVFNGTALSPKSQLLPSSMGALAGNGAEVTEPSGFGIRPKIQGWIDAGVEAAGYSSVVKGLGAIGTALNEFFVPDSKIEAGLAMLGPLAKLGKLGKVAEFAKDAGKLPRLATDKAGNEIGRIIVDSKGNAMIEPLGGRTVAAGKGGVDTHTLYPNGSNYQRLNPNGHANNLTPHGHGHAPGTGPGMKGQGSSLDVKGNIVPWNSPAAHWPIN
jgi:RHS repeat-associated protein